MYITVLDCALGAKSVYKNVDFPGFRMLGGFFDPKNTPRFGWARSNSDGSVDEGGASVATYKFEAKPRMYMIAYRGSAGKPHKEGKDWTDDDLSIGLGRTPDRANDALKYTRAMQQQYAGSFLILVGHSLGGYLAQMCGLMCDLPFITYNAPPALGTWSGKLPNGTSPRNFRLGLNFRVNWDPVSKVSGSHVGPLKTLPHQGMNILNAHGGDAVIKAVKASGMGHLPAMGAITAANRDR